MKRIAIVAATMAALGLGISIDVSATPSIASAHAMQGMMTAPAARSTSATTASGAATQGTTQATRTAQSTQTTRGPARTGQPNQSCEDLGNQPGRSISAPGSAFNPNGTAGGVYAGEQPQNSRNTASVSQYDVACARPTH